MIQLLFAGITLLALATSAHAQVMQSGSITPQHLAMWAANNVVLDAGGAARLAIGLQPFEFGLVAPPNVSGNPFPSTAAGAGPNGENVCLYDAPLGQAGHYLCLSPNLGSNTASIDFGSVGGGATGSLQFLINGSKIAFPGAGTGTVVGPNTSAAADVACWNNTLGTILADCGPAGATAPLAPTQATADNSTRVATTAFVKNQGYLTTATAAFTPQGRLSFASGSPTPSNLGASLTTIYYNNYVGNLVPVWNGSSTVLLAIGGGVISDAVPNSGAGVVLANNVVDIFGVNVGGVLTLCHATNGSGGGWASDTGGSNTNRGTGYTALNKASSGFLSNANALTNCFNGATNLGTIPANQATYLGTAYTIGNGLFTWNQFIVSSGGCSGSSAAVLGIWNYYNRIEYNLQCVDSGSPYTYTSATIRQARASSGNQLQYVKGVNEDQETIYVNGTVATTGSSARVNFGFGFSGSVFSGNSALCVTPSGIVGGGNVCSGSPIGIAFGVIGLETISNLEQGDGVNANTFDASSTNVIGVLIKG